MLANRRSCCPLTITETEVVRRRLHNCIIPPEFGCYHPARHAVLREALLTRDPPNERRSRHIR
jgi:hypothetical protein